MREKIQKKWFRYGVIVLLMGFAGLVYSTDWGTEPTVEWQETESFGFSGKEADDFSAAAEVHSTAAAVWVYVCGAVRNPGVYELPGESRICDAVDAAGGFTEGADQCAVNLAGVLTDGTQIYIPQAGEPAAYGSNETGGNPLSGLVNINTATKEQLMELPGIGAAKAEAILSYRESMGRFTCIEDIMKVSGIKEASFAQIKTLITV